MRPATKLTDGGQPRSWGACGEQLRTHGGTWHVCRDHSGDQKPWQHRCWDCGLRWAE